MSGRRRQRVRVLVAFAVAVCVPSIAFGWGPPASAIPGGLPVDITVSSSMNPSSFFQGVTYTATLTTSDLGNTDPGDTVGFQDNGGGIVGCNNQPLSGTAGVFTATCGEPGSFMSVGAHTITVLFGGDSTYAPGSGTLTQNVNHAATTTVITSPSPGSSVTYGNESQSPIDVMVSGPPKLTQSPSGSVSLYSGTPGPGTLLCTAFLGGGGGGQSSGDCYLDSAQLNAGQYSLTATYGGDLNFMGSSSKPQAFTVDQVPTQMQVFPVPGYAFYGAENGNFFIVGGGGGNGGNPTGFFSITADGVSLIAPGTCSAQNGGANPCYIDSPTALPASTSTYTVTVSYPGDGNFLPASTTVPLTVFPATTSTSLTVSPSTTPSGDESPVTISATVTSGTSGVPSGAVAVQDGGSTVCTINHLSRVGPNAGAGGCAPLSPTVLPAGTYSLTADYSGDGNFQSSISSARPLTITSPVTPGYWEVSSDGGLFSLGTAQFFGSAGAMPLNSPVVGMASTPGGGGYWLVARDGGVFAFGNAHFYGSMGSQPLAAPIVGMVTTPDGQGYWEVAADGGTFAFGDAHFYGSMGGQHLNQPIVGIATTNDGLGYWEVAADGGLFSFGDAAFKGSMGGQHLNQPIVGMAGDPATGGYWEVASDGGLFSFDATFTGSTGSLTLNKPVVGMASTPDGQGYWEVASDGGVFNFGDATFHGSVADIALDPVVGISASA